MLFGHFHRYFYGPIDGTPFTLAIALPDKYGMYELSSQEEIRHSHQNGKHFAFFTSFAIISQVPSIYLIVFHIFFFFFILVTEYLKGTNWRVHPDW